MQASSLASNGYSSPKREERNSAGASFANLPQELLLNIFTRLDKPTLISASVTCKTFNGPATELIFAEMTASVLLDERFASRFKNIQGRKDLARYVKLMRLAPVLESDFDVRFCPLPFSVVVVADFLIDVHS